MRQHSAYWGNHWGHRIVCDLSTVIWSGVSSCVQELQILMAVTVELPLQKSLRGVLIFSANHLKY